jgi:hypothetical protein
LADLICRLLPQTSRQVDSVPTATHTLQHNWRSTNRNTALRRSVRLPINAPELCGGLRRWHLPGGNHSAVEFYEDELLDGPLLPRRLSMAIRRALIRYYRYYLFTIRLLLEHYLKLQRTKIATPHKIIVPKNLDFTDPVYRKKLRLPLAKLGRIFLR